MKRGQFIKKSFLAAGTLAGTSALTAFAKESQSESYQVSQPFKLKYGPHQEQFSNHAGGNILDQIRFAHEQGFRGWEDNFFASRSVGEQEQIGNLLNKLGMEMGVFILSKGGNGANTLAAGKQEHIDIFLQGCRQAVELSKRSGGKFTTVVPGDFERHLPMDIQTANVIDALRRGVEILEPHGIVMVLEPLSDTPNLFLRTSTQAYLICRGVDSPSCKILYDVYHLQRNEGDLIPNMDRCWSEIAYIQVGDNPGRHEPTSGEINYKNLFKFLHNKGYKGVVGMEHGKSMDGKEGEIKLIEAYREVDNFFIS